VHLISKFTSTPGKYAQIDETKVGMETRIFTNVQVAKKAPRSIWDIDPEMVLNPARAGGVYELSLSCFFNASHQVVMKDSLGQLHRHSYHLRVVGQTEHLMGKDQVVVPYEALRKLMDEIAQAYENTVLNDLPPFQNLQPTTENLVGVIAQQLINLSEGLPLKIVEVNLMESPTQGITFRLTDP
jgi:6-pyruvoyl-tetrahydropterin synthase